jgi:hypothetical protein
MRGWQRIRIIKHETVADYGSYESASAPRYFYFEELPGRRLRSDQLTREQVSIGQKTPARAISLAPDAVGDRGWIVGVGVFELMGVIARAGKAPRPEPGSRLISTPSVVKQ